MNTISKSEPYVLYFHKNQWYFLPESKYMDMQDIEELYKQHEFKDNDYYTFWNNLHDYLIDGPQVLRITQWLPY